LEEVGGKLAEMEDEHGSDDGLLSMFEKLNRANITARIKEFSKDKGSEDEERVLQEWLDLNAQESDLKKRCKDAASALDEKVYAKYGNLDEAAVLHLIVDVKWLGALQSKIQTEMERISHCLSGRCNELSQRYQASLAVILEFARHLEVMGMSWR
jgi:type I restriction enzyme M protein